VRFWSKFRDHAGRYWRIGPLGELQTLTVDELNARGQVEPVAPVTVEEADTRGVIHVDRLRRKIESERAPEQAPKP
jgi:hypothetical protein